MQRGSLCKGYEVWGKLGDGGMSEVWLARHQELGVPVILKTLRPSEDELVSTRYERVRSEARLMARITGSNIVRVLDVGLDAGAGGGTPYLVQEYVDGLDLAELDRRRRAALGRPLPVWAVAQLIAEAAEGLRQIHQGGVVHCDIKPSNLFSSPHGELKVGDFGVATAVTSSGALGGTPGYMAPEQVRGERVDVRTDVFGLGVTAYALRYGSPPIATTTSAGTREAIVRMPPARSAEEAYFQHIVAHMTAPRPDARFEDTRALAQLFAGLARSARPHARVVRLDRQTVSLANTSIRFELGNLAETETDVIVNSAHYQMHMRSGVGEALRRRGGAAIEEQATRHGERALGECLHTSAGSLPARGVIHAVGAWKEASCIARAAQRAFLLAEEYGYRRIALPAIGTGEGRVSLEASADAIASALARHVTLGGSRLHEVRFVLPDAASLERFATVAKSVLSDETPEDFDADADAPVTPEEAANAPTVFASSGPLLAVC